MNMHIRLPNPTLSVFTTSLLASATGSHVPDQLGALRTSYPADKIMQGNSNIVKITAAKPDLTTAMWQYPPIFEMKPSGLRACGIDLKTLVIPSIILGAFIMMTSANDGNSSLSFNGDFIPLAAGVFGRWGTELKDFFKPLFMGKIASLVETAKSGDWQALADLRYMVSCGNKKAKRALQKFSEQIAAEIDETVENAAHSMIAAQKLEWLASNHPKFFTSLHITKIIEVAQIGSGRANVLDALAKSRPEIFEREHIAGLEKVKATGNDAQTAIGSLRTSRPELFSTHEHERLKTALSVIYPLAQQGNHEALHLLRDLLKKNIDAEFNWGIYDNDDPSLANTISNSLASEALRIDGRYLPELTYYLNRVANALEKNSRYGAAIPLYTESVQILLSNGQLYLANRALDKMIKIIKTTNIGAEEGLKAIDRLIDLYKDTPALRLEAMDYKARLLRSTGQFEKAALIYSDITGALLAPIADLRFEEKDVMYDMSIWNLINQASSLEDHIQTILAGNGDPAKYYGDIVEIYITIARIFEKRIYVTSGRKNIIILKARRAAALTKALEYLKAQNTVLATKPAGGMTALWPVVRQEEITTIRDGIIKETGDLGRLASRFKQRSSPTHKIIFHELNGNFSAAAEIRSTMESNRRYSGLKYVEHEQRGWGYKDFPNWIAVWQN